MVSPLGEQLESQSPLVIPAELLQPPSLPAVIPTDMCLTALAIIYNWLGDSSQILPSMFFFFFLRERATQQGSSAAYGGHLGSIWRAPAWICCTIEGVFCGLALSPPTRYCFSECSDKDSHVLYVGFINTSYPPGSSPL